MGVCVFFFPLLSVSTKVEHLDHCILLVTTETRSSRTHTHTQGRAHTPIIPPIPTVYPRERRSNKAICCSTVLSSSRPQWAACMLHKHAILSALMDGGPSESRSQICLGATWPYGAHTHKRTCVKTCIHHKQAYRQRSRDHLLFPARRWGQEHAV